MFWMMLWALAVPLAIGLALWPADRAARAERARLAKLGSGRGSFEVHGR